jgi:hypothetical protein
MTRHKGVCGLPVGGLSNRGARTGARAAHPAHPIDTTERARRLLRRKARRACTHVLARLPASALPREWSVGPPDFVGVGAQKSGTSWWYQQIVAHPQVFRPKLGMKELHFFEGRGFRELTERDIERYHRLFPRPRGTITGEWTPGYMGEVWTPLQLKRAAPETRVLAILRDPVERYRSAATHNLQFPGKAELHRDAYAAGFYHDQLRRLSHVFGRERILVLQFERCRADPRAELRRTYAFLGVDDSFVPHGVARVVNPAWRTKVELPAEVLDLLRVGYREDARRLARDFPEIDLALWTALE